VSLSTRSAGVSCARGFAILTPLSEQRMLGVIISITWDCV
jgi:hypothetical protein